MRIFIPVCIALFLFGVNTSAQNVVVDQSFNAVDNGYGKLNLMDNYGSDNIEQIVEQPDGKVLVSGYYYSFNDTVRTCIVRLNKDGSLDNSFKAYGYDVDFGDGIDVMKLLPNGKILLGVIAYSAEFLNNNKHLLLLNNDGSIDSAFTQPDKSIMPYYLYDMAVQPDGKILVAGGSFDSDPTDGNALLRLNANGTLDSTFHSALAESRTINSGVSVHSIALTPDGKILIGGDFVFANDNTLARHFIVKLNEDGSLANDFTADAAVSSDIYKITLQKDGKLLYASNNVLVNGVPVNNLGRLNANGSADATFNIGAGPDKFVKDIKALADGRILIGGNFSHYNNTYAKGIARLQVDGTLDRSFSAGAGVSRNQSFIDTYVRTIYVDKDSNYVIGGRFNIYNRIGAGGIVKIFPDGTINSSFNPARSYGAEDAVYDMVKLNDGKLLVAGDFVKYNGITRYKIARLNGDGTLDEHFTTGTGLQGNALDSNTFIHKILIQPNGKISIGGNFSYINGMPHSLVARLNEDGTVDESMISNLDALFNHNSSEISAMALQKDGKIIVGIRRDYFNVPGGDSPTVYRLNIDGSIDRTFAVSTDFKGYYSPNTIIIQSDGKIVMGGSFYITAGNITYNNIIRLNADGSVDTTFNNNGMSSRGTDRTVFKIQTVQNGKLLLGGNFTHYNGADVPFIIRTKVDGVLDNTFNVPSTLVKARDLQTVCFIADSIGNVYSGSEAYSSDYTYFHSHLYKLSSNGTLDSTYNAGYGANSTIYSMAFDSNNQLLIGGSFTAFNGMGKNHIARLKFTEVLSVNWIAINARLSNSAAALVTWRVANEANTAYYTVERSFNGIDFLKAGEVKSLNNSGTITYSFQDNTISAANGTTIYYRVKAVSEDGKFSYSPAVPVTLLYNIVISVSSNPAKGDVWLQINSKLVEKTTIKIIDAQGKPLTAISAIIPKGSSKQLIPLSRYTTGTYFIVVENSAIKQTLKVVKE